MNEEGSETSISVSISAEPEGISPEVPDVPEDFDAYAQEQAGGEKIGEKGTGAVLFLILTQLY